MVEIMRNIGFRMLFILIPAIFTLFKRTNVKIDKQILYFLGIVFLSEVFTYFHEGYNLIQYSLFSIAYLLAFSFLVQQEIRNKKIIYIGTLIPTFVLVLFLLTDYSSINILDIVNVFPKRSPLDTQQFSDFSAVVNLCFIIITFMWLYDVISKPSFRSGGVTKRFIYIFGFLGYFAGSFFTIAFGRYIIGDIAVWFDYWNKIYLPLYLLFILTLNIGLLWKPTPTPSSSS